MAKIALQKIRISGLRKHYKILMQELHRSGLLHVIDNQDFAKSSTEGSADHFGVFNLARIQFSIDFLSKYEAKKSKIETLLTGGKLVLSEAESKERLAKFSGQHNAVIDECEKIEEKLVKNKNELLKIPAKRQLLESFAELDGDIQADFSSDLTKTWIGSIKSKNKEDFLSAIAKKSNLIDMEVLSLDKTNCYIRITTLKSFNVADILNEFGFESINLASELPEFVGLSVKDSLSTLSASEVDIAAQQVKLEKRAKELALYLDDLKIMFDYNSWRKTKNDLQDNIFRSKTIFAFEAWIPKREIASLTNWVHDAFVKEVTLEKVAIEKSVEPTFIENTPSVSPFEPLVKMYSLPGKTDVDPTRFLAFFFTIFFGMCLSDVGYGGILAGVSAWFLFFGKFSEEARRTILLLLICGLSAMAGGVLFGGYFGITAEQAPSFLLYNGEFIGKMLDPKEEPIRLLLIALSFGMIQMQFGTIIQFVTNLRNNRVVEAVLDSALWFFLIVGITLFATLDYNGLNETLVGYGVIALAVAYLLGQGRNTKNIFLKPLVGFYVLYDKIAAFLSNFLSYARLMALAIATGIVASTMNQIGLTFYEMIPSPIIGVIVAIVFIIFGHSLNFVLSLLGAFIHTVRLQFIEFFDKFYEGGGNEFKPFQRAKKYLFFNK